MRWNVRAHMKNANVLRHVVKGLASKVKGGRQPEYMPSKPKGAAAAPKPSSPKTRVQAVTGGSRSMTFKSRKARAKQLRKVRATPAGRAQLKSQVRRQRP